MRTSCGWASDAWAECGYTCAAGTPAAKAALVRAFDAELATLSAYRHVRIVRLLAYAKDEDPGSRHPFVLAFELLEEGSLADHLRGAAGQPPQRKPALTPLERVDIALGVAAGLAYLHGLREPGEGEGHPAAPVLHRDIKSANVGLTGDGEAKLLDCGVAKAMRPGGAGAEAGAGATASCGVAGSAALPGRHMVSPSHCWPHQHKPSALIRQVPVPQQRSSSTISVSPSFFKLRPAQACAPASARTDSA